MTEAVRGGRRDLHDQDLGHAGVLLPAADEQVGGLPRTPKIDEHTVEVPLLQSCSVFPSLTSWFAAYIVQAGTTDFNKPVGTGPFVYESFTPGVSSTFTANRSYWRGAPYVDSLVINSSFTDDAARVNAVLSD